MCIRDRVITVNNNHQNLSKRELAQSSTHSHELLLLVRLYALCCACMACTLAFVGTRAKGPVLTQPGCQNNDADREIVLSITLLQHPLLFGWARCNTRHGGSRGNTHSGERPFDGRSHCECLYRKYLCRKHHNQQPRNSQLTAFCRRGIDLSLIHI